MVVESVVAKLTAGATFRFGSVALVAGSALADVLIFSAVGRSRPLAVLARMLTWAGLGWGAPLAHLHEWLVNRSTVIVPVIWLAGMLALVAAAAANEIAVGTSPLSDFRWLIAVTFCAAVWAEIDGPGVLWWVVAAVVAAAVLGAASSGDASVLWLLMAPVLLVVLPLLMFFGFLLPSSDQRGGGPSGPPDP